MKAILLRIGAASATGYPLTLYEGEENDVLQRAAANAAPDASEEIALNAVNTVAPAAPSPLDVSHARTVLADADGTDDSLRDMGVELHALLAVGSVGKRWKAARKSAKASKAAGGVVLRTYLQVLDPDIAKLPWEAVHDAGDMLSLQPWAPIVRYSDSAPSLLDEQDLELKVLMVIGAPPSENARIAWVTELRSFLSTVCPQRHTVDFEVFEAHTQSKSGDLKGKLRATIQDFRPHVLHFVGHGLAQKQGGLELYDSSTGQPVTWTAQEFKNALDTAPPRVVLLNACRTSGQAASKQAPIAELSTMSSAALNAGVACVVAMQHDIAGRAAALFASAFYGTLLTGAPVDVAVVNGRARIGDQFSYGDKNWALPVCTVSTPPDALLPRLDRIPSARRVEAQTHSELALLSRFVDRREQRRTIIHSVRGGKAPVLPRSEHVSFVVGESQLGKSSLLRLILEWRHLQGHRVICADFGAVTDSRLAVPHVGPRNVIEVLRHVRGVRGHGADLLRADSYDAFAQFNDTLNALLDSKPIDAVAKTGIDANLPFIHDKLTHQQAWDIIFGAFMNGLRTLADKEPVTIALDHLGKPGHGVDSTAFELHVVPRLLVPLHRGDLKGVSVVIAATSQEVKDCGMSALCDASFCAELERFPFEDWELMAREFAVRSGFDEVESEKRMTIIGALLNGKDWLPKKTLEIFEKLHDVGSE